MSVKSKKLYRTVVMGSALVALSACSQGFDLDMRRFTGGFHTADAPQAQTAERPQPDARGVISYPTYQVALARRGDTVADVAARVGLPADELARFNGLPANAILREGEVVALPRRVAEPPSGPIRPAGTIDITTLAGEAIDRAGVQGATPQADAQTGAEPVRHQVRRGETAYSIARLYGVSVRALADWNGLGADLMVREGQYLLIPPITAAANAAPDETPPGAGSPTPLPPSAMQPLPDEATGPEVAAETPASPDLASERTAASAAAMAMPVNGSIIRAFVRGQSDGIDISASAGAAVSAAADGTVAAITKDTNGVPIVVVRHADNVLTVYANIDRIAVAKGDRVRQGQKIAEVRAGEPAFLHFQVREGTASVDPMNYLN
jgi:murein DD-endopeptidase MepM/ murein hydrolase activator NlpD